MGVPRSDSTGPERQTDRKMLKLAILVGIVAVVAAQTPQPCSSPAQWQGRRIKTDRAKKFQEFSKYTYDATNKRTRAVEEIMQGAERNFYDVLHLYNENKEYRVDLRTKKCNVTTPRHPFFETHVPMGSSFLFEAEVGPSQVPGEHLTAQNWEIKFSDGARYAIAVTSPDCVPIWAAYDGNGIMELENFYDIHAGIDDPSVFIPPSECAGCKGFSWNK